MDIHKPKPVHGFHEFFAEIAVIVVGIAIALSGEQLIEHVHDRHKATEAREGIQDEISHNLAALARRAATQQCIEQRISEIAGLINASADSNYVPPVWLSRPLIWEMVHARWQVVSQAGRAPLLAADEQAGFGFIYALFADISADQDQEQMAWARLRALEGLSRPSAELKDTLRVAVQEARYTNYDIKQLSQLLQEKAAELHIAGHPPEPDQNDGGICFATTTPRAEALRRLSASAHHPIEEP